MEAMKVHALQVRRNGQDVEIWIKTCAETGKPWIVFRHSVCGDTYADLFKQYVEKGIAASLQDVQREAYLAGYRHGKGHKRKEEQFFGDLDAEYWRRLR